MDPVLLEAATTGNVDYLHRLMGKDMFLLDRVALSGAETPLHIASMRGHLHFVQEILKLMKQFAYELNQDGFSPLHLASSNGHLEIVLELLKLDIGLCSIKGKDQRLAVHCAVVKGRNNVMKELLSASPDSVGMKTARRETLFHLAVKNNQFSAFELLVECIKSFGKKHLLNEKDNHGNTILHLAASRKQYEAVRFLLIDDTVTKEAVEVNSLNDRGMTPLDVLLLFQSEAGDLEIQAALLGAGAKKGNEIPASNPSPQQMTSNDNQLASSNATSQKPVLTGSILYWPREKEMAELFGYRTDRDTAGDVRNGMLTVAVLIATAAYQAVLSPPGGLWQDDKLEKVNGTSIVAGKSIMGTKDKFSFYSFLFGNSIGFYSSLTMISYLTLGFPMQYLLWLCSFGISWTYSTSLYSISPGNGSDLSINIILFGGYLLPYFPNVVRRVGALFCCCCRRRPSVNPNP